MLRDFNLLVTTTRRNEAEVCSEIWYLLTEIGDETANVDKTGVSGLITVKTSYPPFEAVERLRTLLQERPFEFQYSLRIIPIQEVVDTTIQNIEDSIARLAPAIEESETFRVTVEKRHSNVSSREVIEAAAAHINRTVDLTASDKVVLVEIVGGRTGISILKPSDIISVAKEKVTASNSLVDYR